MAGLSAYKYRDIAEVSKAGQFADDDQVTVVRVQLMLLDQNLGYNCGRDELIAACKRIWQAQSN